MLYLRFSVFKNPKVRRELLPKTREKSSIRNLFSFLKTVIGKDLTKVTMPVYFNEPVSFLQVSSATSLRNIVDVSMLLWVYISGVYPHRASWKNTPGHGVFQVRFPPWPGVFFKLAQCGYTLRVTSLKMRYSPICACAQRSPFFIYKQFI